MLNTFVSGTVGHARCHESFLQQTTSRMLNTFLVWDSQSRKVSWILPPTYNIQDAKYICIWDSRSCKVSWVLPTTDNIQDVKYIFSLGQSVPQDILNPSSNLQHEEAFLHSCLRILSHHSCVCAHKCHSGLYLGDVFWRGDLVQFPWHPTSPCYQLSLKQNHHIYSTSR
jgi:hypothetical protein